MMLPSPSMGFAIKIMFSIFGNNLIVIFALRERLPAAIINSLMPIPSRLEAAPTKLIETYEKKNFREVFNASER